MREEGFQRSDGVDDNEVQSATHEADLAGVLRVRRAELLQLGVERWSSRQRRTTSLGLHGNQMYGCETLKRGV